MCGDVQHSRRPRHPQGEQALESEVPDVIFCLRSHIVPPEVRMLQLAVASCMDGLLSCDDRLFYQTTLRIAKQMHDVGVRVVA